MTCIASAWTRRFPTLWLLGAPGVCGVWVAPRHLRVVLVWPLISPLISPKRQIITKSWSIRRNRGNLRRVGIAENSTWWQGLPVIIRSKQGSNIGRIGLDWTRLIFNMWNLPHVNKIDEQSWDQFSWKSRGWGCQNDTDELGSRET